MTAAEMLQQLGVDVTRAQAEACEIVEDLHAKGIGDPEVLIIVLSVAASVEGAIREGPGGTEVADALMKFCEDAREHVLKMGAI